MSSLIPHLRDLCFDGHAYRLPSGFAEGFVKLHNEDWETAQEHWEVIVVRVLNTDAVESGASARRAMFQAVAASAILLWRTDLRDRCPLCARMAQRREGSRR